MLLYHHQTLLLLLLLIAVAAEIVVLTLLLIDINRIFAHIKVFTLITGDITIPVGCGGVTAVMMMKEGR